MDGFQANSERVLVLGATGHIGQAVVRHCVAVGSQVTAASRQAAPVSLQGIGATVVRLDDGLEGLSSLAAGHSVMIDAAAPHPLDPMDRFGAVAAAVRRTERVLAAAREHNMRLVFVSSFTTLPRTDSPLEAMGAAWRRSVYPYFAAKVEMEQQVLDAVRAGLPAVVVNPAACLGPWEYRGGEASFVRAALSGRLGTVMDQTLSVIDNRDVAAALLAALARRMYGRPIPLAGHNTTVAALVSAITGAAPLTVDSRLAAAAAFWTEAGLAAFGQPVPAMWRAVPLIADGFPMSPSADQFAMDLRLRPLAETIGDAVAFHREF